MSKFLDLLKGKTTPKQSPWMQQYKPPTLTKKEIAVAVLAFCATSSFVLPAGTKKILDKIDPNQFKPLYKDLLEMWQRRDSDYIMEELEVLYSIVLERTIEQQRRSNKDFDGNLNIYNNIYGNSQDIYDLAGV
jgi:hypothetical protein